MANLKRKKGKNGKYGFVDDSGNWVIEPRFTSAKRFESGLAPVSENYWWGILKQDGTWLVKPQFDDAEIRNGHLIMVYENGIEGYVDAHTGEIDWEEDDEEDDEDEDER